MYILVSRSLLAWDGAFSFDACLRILQLACFALLIVYHLSYQQYQDRRAILRMDIGCYM